MKIRSLIKESLLISIFSIIFFLTTDFLITKYLRIRGNYKFFESNKDAGYILKRNFSGRFGGPLDEFFSNVNITKFGTRKVISKNCELDQIINKENIIFVGDSMLAGLEVDDNEHYTSRVQNTCISSGQIINGGVLGTATHMSLANASRILDEYNLLHSNTKIIYGVTTNDFSENLNIGGHSLKLKFGYIYNNKRYLPEKNLRIINFKIFISDNFYFSKHLIKFLGKKLLINNPNNLFMNEKFTNKFKCKKMVSILDKTVKAKSIKSNFYVFIHPNFSNFKRSYKMEKCLKEEVKEKENITFFSLHDEVRKIMPKSIVDEDLYFPNDGHYNSKGHYVISKALVSILSRL